jgi:NADH dehydrogenase
MNKVLVLGGTGLLGVPVVHRLKADGFEVRLLARDPDKARATFEAAGGGAAAFEVVAGDVADVGSLEAALAGCDGVHISVGGPVDRLSAENVAALAPGLGLKRITYVSGSTVFEENRWFPMTAQKLDAEKALRACGVPYTIFCPTWPLDMLPRYARGGQPLMIGDQPLPYHWFAADDMARMISNAYRCEEAAGKKLFVHGPEAMTTVEALERYCQAFHPEVESVPLMPIEAARATAASTGNQMLGFFAELMAYFEQVGEMGDPAEADQLLGAPTTTLDAWIEQRKARELGY